MSLGSGTKRDTSKVDVVIETRKELWIIEAKYTEASNGIGPIEKAVNSVRDYYDKILKLGWWKTKTKLMAIVWGVADEAPKSNKSLFEIHQIELE